MPNRQIGPPRGHGVAHALVQGAALAYKHRGVIKHAAHATHKVVRKVFRKKTTTKRTVHKKHDQPDTGVGAEFTKMSISFGKPVKHKLPKLLQASIKSITGRASWVNQYDNPASVASLPGSLALHNYQPGANVNATYMPLHLIDITSWFNNVNGTLSYSAPVFTMLNDASGNVAFGSSVNTWFVEQAADLVPNTMMYTRESDLLKSVTAKFLFYGATAKPTKFMIDLITLNDDSLHPDTTVAMNGIGGNTNVNLALGKSAFWTSLVRPFLWSPLITGDTKATSGKKYKVHQHTEFILQEKLTNEPTSFAGHMKQVNYTLNLDRIQRYDWNNKVTAQIGTIEGTANINQELGDLETVVAPKRRMYIMLRAQSAFNNGSNPDPSKGPSYDLVLRAKHESIV